MSYHRPCKGHEATDLVDVTNTEWNLSAKMVEYLDRSWRLACLVRGGALERVTSVVSLYEIAIAQAVDRAPGEGGIEAIIAGAFAGARPLYARGSVA
jgi:hypothetical protein